MAHNVRIRAGGTWTNGSTLLSTEMASFDTSLFKQVNGDDGGSWAPAAQIILGGSGMSVTGAFAFANLTSGTINGTLTVANGGFLYFVAGATLDMLNGAIGTWNGNATLTFSGTAALLLTSTALLSAANGTTVQLNGATTFGATAVVSYNAATTVAYGGQTSSGILTRSGQTILSGGSASIGYRLTTLSDASQTVAGGAFDVVVILGALTNDSNFLFSVPPNSIKCMVRISRPLANAKLATILNWNSAVLHVMDNTGTGDPWLELYFNGTNWVVLRYGTGG
jgi:hypothetical protein